MAKQERKPARTNGKPDAKRAPSKKSAPQPTIGKKAPRKKSRAQPEQRKSDAKSTKTPKKQPTAAKNRRQRKESALQLQVAGLKITIVNDLAQ